MADTKRPKPTRPKRTGTAHEHVRTGLTARALWDAVRDHLFYLLGRHAKSATLNDVYLAVAYAVRDRLFQRGADTIDALLVESDAKVVAYLSAEFLMGPHLGANLLNLDIVNPMRDALGRAGIDLNDVLRQEEEPGLGNGGLGRLAACYMDSLATLQIPAIGYGIRYEFGIFDQEIRDGWQVEVADKWLRWGNPWEIVRPELSVNVGFGGRTETSTDQQGRVHVRWIPSHIVRGVPHDTPVLGYHSRACNLLRLWQAQAVESFDLAAFNVGDYEKAVEEKLRSENVSKVLYPNDESVQGKVLRLQQQYFFVSSTLQDMIRLHLRVGGRLDSFHTRWAVQLNDTHPAVAVAELMRLLVDQHGFEWDAAWDITVRTMGYTNHTLLPEALEKWPLELFGSLLPRHLEIVYEINRRLLDQIRLRFPDDPDRAARMSIIDEHGNRYVRMANLACAGSHAVNGVSALHTDLLKREVLPDWVDMFPDRFCSVTNGVTPRRFLMLCNPGLAALITDAIGDTWTRNLDDLRKLEPFAADAAFRKRWREIKLQNKRRLAGVVLDRTGVTIKPDALLSIQAKRLHEYKRQHLNVLHILSLYLRLKRAPDASAVPRTFLFGGKAAPSYRMAKLIIKLITATADVVNRDPDIGDRLKVVFFPDFNVKNAEVVYPAADLSEQISTAGKEASGTGNMKFSLNGALTIGTLDGANVEIREAVGADNFFLFGLTAEQVGQAKANGYNPRAIYERNEDLHAVIDFVRSGALAAGDTALFAPIVEDLLTYDPYMVLEDFASYVETERRAADLWQDASSWTRMSILNVARVGHFSSDRSIQEYCERVWHARPVLTRPHEPS